MWKIGNKPMATRMRAKVSYERLIRLIQPIEETGWLLFPAGLYVEALLKVLKQHNRGDWYLLNAEDCEECIKYEDGVESTHGEPIINADGDPLCPQSWDDNYCASCTHLSVAEHGAYEPWPCPTIRAIASALNVELPEEE